MIKHPSTADFRILTPATTVILANTSSLMQYISAASLIRYLGRPSLLVASVRDWCSFLHFIQETSPLLLSPDKRLRPYVTSSCVFLQHPVRLKGIGITSSIGACHQFLLFRCFLCGLTGVDIKFQVTAICRLGKYALVSLPPTAFCHGQDK